MVRRGEVAGQWEARFELLVVMELRSVVEGECMEATCMLSERLTGCAGDLSGGACPELLDHGIAGFAL